MYADYCLTALISVVELEISQGRNTHVLHELFSPSKAQQGLDKLSFLHFAHCLSDYRRFILEFLEDPRRSGIYTFTREQYSTAAVYFIKYISNHPELITPSLSTLERKYIQKRSTPWRWRKIVKETHPSEAAQIARWQLLKNQGRLSLRWNSSNIFKSDRAFGLAMTCLVHVLPQCASSEKLTILASQHAFGPLSRKRPNRKSAVKQEIARYLARAEKKGS
ncbi:hypothetical protein GALMADRAFT_563320 [Galerina marginata CBS 339.88]|uniref:Uncharacterized protein n=1 Tax=Galerina marginata (strain CBS 339.88) TaxID=685588 RepID=A0A067SV88_GALM3|nr:hypothetical protein GALMADRAFT_563320 [Galerina marginata CBS 339.88]